MGSPGSTCTAGQWSEPSGSCVPKGEFVMAACAGLRAASLQSRHGDSFGSMRHAAVKAVKSEWAGCL